MCSWQKKGGCIGGKPPSCERGLQELTCLNQATNTSRRCEGRCAGDNWEKCSQKRVCVGMKPFAYIQFFLTRLLSMNCVRDQQPTRKFPSRWQHQL